MTNRMVKKLFVVVVLGALCGTAPGLALGRQRRSVAEPVPKALGWNPRSREEVAPGPKGEERSWGLRSCHLASQGHACYGLATNQDRVGVGRLRLAAEPLTVDHAGYRDRPGCGKMMLGASGRGS